MEPTLQDDPTTTAPTGNPVLIQTTGDKPWPSKVLNNQVEDLNLYLQEQAGVNTGRRDL